MKFVSVQRSNKIAYASLEGNKVKIIHGDIFGEWHFSKDTYLTADVKFLAPVKPPQIIAIGLNYHAHAYECNMAVPNEPVIFLKGVNTIIGHDEPIILPSMAPDEVDYEAELVVVIGKEAKNVPFDEASNYMFGFTCGNDISASDCQLRKDSQWARGKSFDTFAPIGHSIVTDVNGDNLNISLFLNGKVMQQSNTSDMIFSCRKVVSFLSSSMTLSPGTIIMTGTPSGVGVARIPPIYLRESDVVTVEIEKIGKLTNFVIKENGG